MIVVAGKFKVKSEKIEQLIKLSLDMLEPSRKDPGCLSYSFYENASKDGEFLFFEEWLDQASLDAHFETKHFKHFMVEFPDLILGSPVIKIYSVEGVKQL